MNERAQRAAVLGKLRGVCVSKAFEYGCILQKQDDETL